MATERFFVFHEDGTLKRLKGRIVRFLDNEDPDNDDKAAIRSSLSVPASGEGLTPANNLSDVASAATSRTNLGVNGIAEDAEATGTKLVSPSLYLDGVNDYLEIADSDNFYFSSGTDDTPTSFAAWVKFDTSASTYILAQYGTSNPVRAWAFYVSATNDLRLEMADGSGNAFYVDTDAVLTGYDGKWVHLAASYAGAGPGSSNAFAVAGSGVKMYVNGKLVNSTPVENASYGGQSNVAQAVWIGRLSSSYGEFHCKEIKLFNRELSATEVVNSMNGDLGFADEWGGATATSGTLTVGKRYRLQDWITADDFTNVGAASNADGVEFIATGTTPTTWANSSVVESIGTLLDARAENFNEAGGELLDLSSNAFVAINNGATQVGGRMHLQASSLDLTGIPTTSAGLSTGEVWSNSGVLTMV
jgi:hypothetical protein